MTDHLICEELRTGKVWVTEGAAEYVELPAWVAVMEQAPSETMVTVDPDTVQVDVGGDAKATAKPELAVAAIVNGLDPDETLAGATNVMA